MSTSEITTPPRSANIADCVRLWSTLTTEYIPGLKLELELCHSPNGDPYLTVSVLDYATYDASGDLDMSVWAHREFRNQLHLISISQLFDLLISAYRTIDTYFSTGVDNRPRPVKG